ncbi:MAG: class I SAM-dependent methyltransferase [Actinobacteria bacterium]|nr:class I SAM-dependent methyltransferase [Actinomycetota bacterium]
MAEPGEEDYRLYRELAEWWPLISPASEYAEDAVAIEQEFAAGDLPVRTLLDLGSGGGHVALHLKHDRSVTLVDLSADMLSVSRQLNPDCEHVQGDMRAIRLGRTFDAVLVHDAIDYVTCQDDLALVISTAFAHCRPGGLAVFMPDHTAETFRPGTGAGGGNDGAGRQASFTERTTDPDAGDDWILAEYEFTLTEPDGRVRVVPERHRLGSFSRVTWLALLTQAGFGAAARPLAGHGRQRRVMFTGRRARLSGRDTRDLPRTAAGSLLAGQHEERKLARGRALPRSSWCCLLSISAEVVRAPGFKS